VEEDAEEVAQEGDVGAGQSLAESIGIMNQLN